MLLLWNIISKAIPFEIIPATQLVCSDFIPFERVKTMAIKSRLLSKLKFTYMTTTMAATAHPQKLRPVLHNLEEARELCQQGLTESNYAKYGEVYDGVIMAVKQILSGEAGKDAGEIVGLCKELLEHIMAETGKEEHFKKEIVFLPYKASMWDSLESVWRAAYEDKDNCLAYVIPIPYCDRNPDGTAKEWHCERDLFPKDVPTLDWQEVDLKTMHPDVIFFHYPYDDCNQFNRNSIQLRKLGACPKPLEIRGFGDLANFESVTLYQISNQL